MITNHTILSCDIAASSSREDSDKEKLQALILEWSEDMKTRYGLFSRIVEGQFLECYINQPALALRLALLLRTRIKSRAKDLPSSSPGKAVFLQHGIRVAIGIGSLTRLQLEKERIEGNIIQQTRRILEESHHNDLQKISVKESLFFLSPWEQLNFDLQPHLAWLHENLARCTAKQCEVLYLKLLGFGEKEIQQQLGKAQSTVNNHTTQSGWSAVEKTLNWYEHTIKTYCKS